MAEPLPDADEAAVSVEASQDRVTDLDMLLVTPEIVEIWQSRSEVAWEAGTLWVVSRRGLMALKSLRSSAQDLADIERLKEIENES